MGCFEVDYKLLPSSPTSYSMELIPRRVLDAILKFKIISLQARKPHLYILQNVKLCVWLMFHLAPECMGSERKLNIEILTYGFSTPSSHGTIWWTKVGMDHAVTELRHLYANTTNITHSYVLNSRSRDCMELVAEIDVMLSEWYYKQKKEADLYAIIAPGKRLKFSVTLCEEMSLSLPRATKDYDKCYPSSFSVEWQKTFYT